MTCDKEALIALRDRVREANEADREIDAMLLMRLGLCDEISDPVCGPEIVNELAGKTYAHPAPITASIDAAKALMERVLPGCEYQLCNYEFPVAMIRPRGLTGWFASYLRDPALAILDAILTALIERDTAT